MLGEIEGLMDGLMEGEREGEILALGLTDELIEGETEIDVLGEADGDRDAPEYNCVISDADNALLNIAKSSIAPV